MNMQQPDLLVIKIQGHSMTNEILSSRLKTEFLIDSLHAIPVEVDP